MTFFRSRMFVLMVVGVLFLGCASLRSESPTDQSDIVSIKPLDGKLRVEIDGELFTEYVYKDTPRPILYPVIGPHGVAMTRNFPMKKDVKGEANDHPHHRSLWFTHGLVNGVDFWSEGPKTGKIVQDKILKTTGGPKRGSIQTSNKWVGPDGKVRCTDTRTTGFEVLPDGRIIDFEVTIHASQGDLTLGDTKEGSMAIRTHPNLRLSNDPRGGVTTANGQALNSEGVSGKDLWGKRAKWVDYWGKIDEKTVGVAIFDHPDNPRYPTWWHARDYGLITANPFGVHNFEGKPKGAGDMVIKAGESVTFRWRFFFHEGSAEQAKIALRCRQYAEPKPVSK